MKCTIKHLYFKWLMMNGENMPKSIIDIAKPILYDSHQAASSSFIHKYKGPSSWS